MNHAFPTDAEAAAHSATLRPVRSADATAMERFVMGLSAASRRMRFHGAVNACSPELLRRLTQADGVRHVAYVACIDDGDGGEQIVGEARYFVSGSESAEFAIAVADSQRGRGLADDLLRALLRSAGAAGLAQLYGDVLDGNARMAVFMQRHGFAVDMDADADPGTARWQRGLRQTLRGTGRNGQMAALPWRRNRDGCLVRGLEDPALQQRDFLQRPLHGALVFRFS